MANLLTGIRSLINQPQQAEAPVGGATGRLQSLVRAGQTGKQLGTGSGPALQTGTAERQAASQAVRQQQQLAGQQQLQRLGATQQAEQQVQQEQIQTAEIQDRTQRLQDQMNRQATKLANDLRRGQGQLDDERKKLAAEQIAFNLRLQNKQYLSQLQQAGEKQRLDDNREFEEQLALDIMGEEAGMFKSLIDSKALLDANDREFDRELANINIDAALQQYRSEARAANQRALYEGAAGVGTGAIGVWSSRDTSSGASPTGGVEGRAPGLSPTTGPAAGAASEMASAVNALNRNR